MKRKLVFQCKFIVVFAFVAFVFNACKKDNPNSTGLNILPGSDLAVVGKVVEKETIEAFTYSDIKLRTDETSYNLLGTLNDPHFGKTTADFACQFRLDSYPYFGTGATIDSLVLTLLYKDVYGDTLTNQYLKVYELQSDLNIDDSYVQDVDLKALSYPTPIAEYTYVPVFRMDSTLTDTIIQELNIKLDNSLAEKLINADSLQMINNDVFMEFFKGLYVEAQDQEEGEGALLGIYSLAAASRMSLYYHNDAEDSLAVSYRINSNSARVSRYVHDYTSADFYSNLNTEVNPDSLIYLQTLGGLHVKVNIPNLDAWKDSSNFIINKAELIFQVDTIASDYHHFALPKQLLLSVLDSEGTEYLPADFNVSADLYGGKYDETNATYSFNISRHLQNIIEGDLTNYGFYLSDYSRNELARRAILKGSTSKTGICLEVTYTKLN